MSIVAAGLPLVPALGTAQATGTSQTTTTRLSLNAGAQLTAESRRPAYSADGRWIAYDSAATNSSTANVPTGAQADTNGSRDVIVRDRTVDGSPGIRVSVNNKFEQSTGDSWGPVLNGGAALASSGRFVAFLSNAMFDDGNGEGNERPCDDPSPDESAPGQGNEARDLNGALTDIYVRDRNADERRGSTDFDVRFTNAPSGTLPFCGTETSMVSVGSDELQANKPNGYKSVDPGSIGISNDGRFVVFATPAQLVTTNSDGRVRSVDTDQKIDVYVRDRDTNGNGLYDDRDFAATYLLSLNTAAASDARRPTISGTGNVVAFEDGGNVRVVQLTVSATGIPTVAERGVITNAKAPSIGGSFSGGNGGWVAFERSGTIVLAKLADSGAVVANTETAATPGTLPVMSATGASVAYSLSGDVRTADIVGTALGASRLVNRPLPGLTNDGASGALGDAAEVAVYDGPGNNDYVAFSSASSKLVENDTNGVRDVFERLRDLSFSSLTTTVDKTSVAGPRGVRLADIDPSALSVQPGLLETVLQSIGGQLRPISGQLRSIGGQLRPISGQMRSIGGQLRPISGQLRSIGGQLRTLNITLDQLQVDSNVDLPALLKGTQFDGWPLQLITFLDLLLLVDQADPGSALGQLDLFQLDPSGVVLGDLSLASVLLGATSIAALQAAGAPANLCDLVGPIVAPPAGESWAVDPCTTSLIVLDFLGADISKLDLSTINVQALVANSGFDQGSGVAQLVASTVPTPATLEGLLIAYVVGGAFPWQDIALTRPGYLAAAYGSGGPVNVAPYALGEEFTYTTTMKVSGPGTGAGEITIALPSGFAFVPGSATCNGSPCAPLAGKPSLTFAVSVTSAADGIVTVRARPKNLILGDAQAGVVYAAAPTVGGALDGAAVPTSNGPTVSVIDPWAAPGTRTAEKNTLYFGDIATTGETDTYALDIGPHQAGTRIQVWLSGMLASDVERHDLDLTMLSTEVGGDNNDVPGSELPGSIGGQLRTLSGQLRSIGGQLRPINGQMRSLTIEDVGTDNPSSLPPEILADSPTPVAGSGSFVRAASANRGNEPDAIDTYLTAGDGPVSLSLQVTGYNDSTGPYVLHVVVTPPPLPSPAECGVPAAPASLNLSSLGTAQTLILYPSANLNARYPGNGLAAKVSALVAEEAALGRTAVVADVTTATDWTTTDTCSPVRANAVAAALQQQIVGLVVAQANAGGGDAQLQNVVIVGADNVLPMYRVADQTEVANERSYASSYGVANPLSIADGAARVLTDNIYGELNPIAVGDSVLLVPDLAVGRLVEKPDEIAAQIDRYVASHGRLLDNSQALSAYSYLATGYDFLTDTAAAVKGELDGTDVDPSGSLATETWNENTLLGALGQNPNVMSLNAHFDHQSLLTAAGNSGNVPYDQLGLNELPQGFNSFLVFSVGCHSGLNVPDTYGDPALLREQDWAQRYAANATSALYVANTGFGYGDDAEVGYSERLMLELASRIQTMSAGQALVAAKQEYAASLGEQVSYDHKVIHESTLYGLPMYRLQQAPAASPGAAFSPGVAASAVPSAGLNPTPVTGVPGLSSASLTVTNQGISTQNTSTDKAFAPKSPAFNVTGGASGNLKPEVQVTHGYPLAPKVQVDVTAKDASNKADPTRVARGVLLTSLTSNDVDNVTPQYSRATVDLADRERPFAADEVYFPTSFATVNNIGGPGGGGDRLVMLPGQIRKNDVASKLREFTSMSAQVLYADPSQTDDFMAPSVDSVFADSFIDSGGGVNVLFRVRADDVGSGSARSGMWRIVVLFDVAGTWTPVELVRLSPTSNEWVGALLLSNANQINGRQFMVQVADKAGNTAMVTDKGRFYQVSDQQPSVVTLIIGGLGDNGWYRTGPNGSAPPVLVQLAGSSVKVDGTSHTLTYTLGATTSGPTPYTGPSGLTVGGVSEGIFTVVASGIGNDVTLTREVKVDGTPPVITASVDGVNIPANGTATIPTGAGGNVSFVCADPVSGVSPGTCPSNTSVNRSVPGTTTFTVTARDVAGNVTPLTTFTVNVIDNQAPTLTITPTAIGPYEATGPGGASVNLATAVSVTATDNVTQNITPSCTFNGQQVLNQTVTFPVGTSTVSCSATDGSGNTSTGSYTVTVQDLTAPRLTLPADITVPATSASGAVVTFTATATDLVTGTRPVSCTPPSGSTFPVGTTTVTCTATDRTSTTDPVNAPINTATGTFRITVLPFKYTYSGFYSPVSMGTLDSFGIPNVVNGMNAGRTLPLKFEIFAPNGTELTNPNQVDVRIMTETAFRAAFPNMPLPVPANAAGNALCVGKPVVPLNSADKSSALKFSGGMFNIGLKTDSRPTVPNCYVAFARVTTDANPGITALVSLSP